MSRIHLLMLLIDESHSRWPGALSLMGEKGSRKGHRRAQRVKCKDDVYEGEKTGGKCLRVL